jgi:hypothetical protein
MYTGATSSDFHDQATVRAELTETSEGFAVSGETITFTLGSGFGAPACTQQTDLTGIASCSLTPNQAEGTYAIMATFAGDSSVAASSASTSLPCDQRGDCDQVHREQSDATGQWQVCYLLGHDEGRWHYCDFGPHPDVHAWSAVLLRHNHHQR